MADGTKIEWTDATWNVITGCSVVSPGCTSCYAMKLAGTRLRNIPSRVGLTVETKAGPVWNGEVRFNAGMLDQPLRWRRPRMIFVCAHGDLFHEGAPDEWIDQVFAVMALAPHHTFQVLTKRAERMRDYMRRVDDRGRHPAMVQAALMAFTGRWNTPPLDLRAWPLPNVWLGVSAEDQRRADDRVPVLLDTPAEVRWVSAEPLLGPLDLSDYLFGKEEHGMIGQQIGWRPPLDWVVVGGESGHAARPMHPDWARSLRDQCARDEVPFLFKQHGSFVTAIDRDVHDPDWRQDYTYALRHDGRRHVWLNLEGGMGFHGERFHVMRRVDKAIAGRTLDGVMHDGFPQCDEVPFG